MDAEPILAGAIGSLTDLVIKREDEIRRLKAALAKRQGPEGETEERVAEWLRERGYAVTRANGQ